MKKVVFALAVIATVACFSSCSKKCTCKDLITGSEVEYDLDELQDKYNIDIDNWADFNVAGIISCE